MAVKPGYWRSSYDSEKIMQCLEETACIGGVLPIGYNPENSNNTFPLCAIGYGGNLCGHCENVNGI